MHVFFISYNSSSIKSSHLKLFQSSSSLLIILVRLIIHDIVEAKLVDAFGGGHDAQPVAKLLLLQVLFGAEKECILE